MNLKHARQGSTNYGSEASTPDYSSKNPSNHYNSSNPLIPIHSADKLQKKSSALEKIKK